MNNKTFEQCSPEEQQQRLAIIDKREAEESAALERSLITLIGRHGIANVVTMLAKVAADWGAGQVGKGQPISPDLFWQATGLLLAKVADRISVLSKR
jgi:hypothetical protein